MVVLQFYNVCFSSKFSFSVPEANAFVRSCRKFVSSVIKHIFFLFEEIRC